MRLVLYVLATIGCFLCLVYALLPTLCIGEPFWAFAFVGIFALVAVACGQGTQRVISTLALIVGLAGSIHAYHHNQRVIAAMRESWRRGEVQRRQWMQQTATNGLDTDQTNRLEAAQTTQFDLPEPRLSPFNCCP